MSNGNAVSDQDRAARASGMPPGLAAPPVIVKEGVWVATGQAVVVLAGLAGTRVLTTILPPATYGEVSLVTGLGALGAGLFCAPFHQAALRSFPDAREAGKIGALRGLASWFLRRGVVAVALLLAAASAGWALARSGSPALTVFIAAAAVVAADAWRNFESGFLNGARRQREFAVRTSLDAIARPVAATALALALGPLALHVVAGYAIGSLAVGVLLRRHVVSGAGPDAGAEDPWAVSHRTAFWRYAAPLIPLAGLNWMMSMGDRYVLAGHWGAGAVGIYAAAYALGSQPFIAANALIHTTLRPVLYDAVARGDAAKERRTLRVWFLVVGGIAAGGWMLTTLLAKVLCAVLLGPAYAGAAELLPWIAAAYALQMIQQAFEIILYAHGGSRRLVALQATAAAAATLFYFVLIPRYGALGAALGTLGTFVITSALAFVLSGAWRRLAGPAVAR